MLALVVWLRERERDSKWLAVALGELRGITARLDRGKIREGREGKRD